jgi:hypothetical protein
MHQPGCCLSNRILQSAIRWKLVERSPTYIHAATTRHASYACILINTQVESSHRQVSKCTENNFQMQSLPCRSLYLSPVYWYGAAHLSPGKQPPGRPHRRPSAEYRTCALLASIRNLFAQQPTKGIWCLFWRWFFCIGLGQVAVCPDAGSSLSWKGSR